MTDIKHQERGMSARKRWRCFHCDEVFISRNCAKLHFGKHEGDEPACIIKGSDWHLLKRIRAQEEELVRLRSEDTDLMRAIWAMDAEHAQALRREEEKGYARGLADGMKEAAIGATP